MAEPTLDFIGHKLKAIQDEQRLQRMRFDILEQRIDSRLEGVETHLASIWGALRDIVVTLDRIAPAGTIVPTGMVETSQ